MMYLIFLGPCHNNPCQNGGTCTATGGQFSCECDTGFSGNTCENGIFMNNN